MGTFAGCRAAILSALTRCRPSTCGLLAILCLPFATSPSLAVQSPAEGRAAFDAKCVACHSTGADRVVGPGLEGVTLRRDRAWLIAFITDPDGMTARGDSIATRLLAEYQVPMPNLGVTKAEAEAIMAYLVSTGDASATGQAPEPGAETADAGAGATPPTDGDPSVGRELFTGARRLENSGAACISCHAVAGIGASGGGMLAKDLTEAAATYGDALPELVRAAPFTVMRAVFGPQPLTEAEVADLSAFLVEAAASGQAGSSSLAFPLSGLAGAILLGALAGLAGRGRLKGVRKPLIGGRG